MHMKYERCIAFKPRRTLEYLLAVLAASGIRIMSGRSRCVDNIFTTEPNVSYRPHLCCHSQGQAPSHLKKGRLGCQNLENGSCKEVLESLCM